MTPRFDFSCVTKRLSTWLAALSLAAGGALTAYAVFPERLQGLIPDGALVALGAVAMGAAFLTPIATSYLQKNIPATRPGNPPGP